MGSALRHERASRALENGLDARFRCHTMPKLEVGFGGLVERDERDLPLPAVCVDP
jgi:hypothetical protein